MDFFFYGTLLDADVRRLALGSGAGSVVLAPARLVGYRRLAKLTSSVPVLVRRPGSGVEGLLARGIDRRQAARLRHYEGRHYRLLVREVRLESGARVRAAVYFGRGRSPVRRAPWRLAEWQRRHKRAYLKLAALWLAAYREAGYLGRGRVRWVKRWSARDAAG